MTRLECGQHRTRLGYTIFLDRLAGEMHPQARKQHWLVTHGDEDELLPLARTRSQMERLKELGVPIEWHEFHKGHTLDPERELPLIRNWIAGGGTDSRFSHEPVSRPRGFPSQSNAVAQGQLPGPNPLPIVFLPFCNELKASRLMSAFRQAN